VSTVRSQVKKTKYILCALIGTKNNIVILLYSFKITVKMHELYCTNYMIEKLSDFYFF